MEFTVICAEVTAQVRVAPLVVRVGGLLSPVTVVLAVEVQPLPPLVTVTV